ncbi:VOC family protein [Polymorphospora rubra]|uniref:VOC family protein n=1 Tax=Polymorphospora rubra TaxID=338584 RepID=UPI0031E2F705
MANGRRRPVAPVRKLAAAVLGTFATFVILFGAGMMSWAIVALGVALLVLAVSFLVVTAMRRGARAWVAGVAHVHSATEPPASSTYGRCEMQIVIDAPGVPPRSVKVRDPRVPVSKWPDPGATLPIMVAIDDPRHVRILWDDVLTHAEASMTADHLPPEFHDHHEPLDDEILIEQDLPPWQRRDPDDDFGPMVEPLPTDLDDDLGRAHADTVIIHHDQRPGRPIVLEGTLVDSPSTAPPLPKRAKPSPHRPRQRTAPADPSEPAGDPAPDQGHSDVDEPVAAQPPADTATSAAAAGGSAVAGATTSGGTTAVADPPVTGRKTGPAAAGHDDFDVDLDLDLDPDPGLGASHPPADTGPTPSGGIISGSGITVTVADLPRSVAFYRDMLGFHEIDGGDNNAVLASGNTRLVLWATPDVTPVNRRVTHLNLDVADVQAAYRQLRANGVRFTSEPRVVNRGARVEQWAAAFKDPDGHGIALTEWRDRTD